MFKLSVYKTSKKKGREVEADKIIVIIEIEMKKKIAVKGTDTFSQQ